MKKLKDTKLGNTLKKTILTAVVTASAVAPLKAAAKAEGTPEGKKDKIEMKVSAAPEWLITDENGKFDDKVVSDAFSKMKYEEKIPQVQEIYKDAKEKGFSDKHVDQLTKLFGGDKAMGESIKRALEDAKKSEKFNKICYGVGGTALGGFAWLMSVLYLMASAGVGEGGISLEASDILQRKSFIRALVGSAFLYVGVDGLTTSEVNKTINSQELMAQRVNKVQKVAYQEYEKQAKHEIVELAPGALEAKFAEKAKAGRN